MVGYGYKLDEVGVDKEECVFGFFFILCIWFLILVIFDVFNGFVLEVCLGGIL